MICNVFQLTPATPKPVNLDEIDSGLAFAVTGLTDVSTGDVEGVTDAGGVDGFNGASGEETPLGIPKRLRSSAPIP